MDEYVAAFFALIQLSVFPVAVKGHCIGWSISPSFLYIVYLEFLTCFRPEYS